MSTDALSPRQFGPDGKYTTRPLDMFGRPATHFSSHIEAIHTSSGRRIGGLNWTSTPVGTGGRTTNSAGQSIEPDKPTIFKVVVSKPMRRKGVASAMLEHARDIAPGLQHSHALSEDGEAWARARP